MYSSQKNLESDSRIWNFQLKSGCTNIAMNLSLGEAIFDTLGEAVIVLDHHQEEIQEKELCQRERIRHSYP